MRADFHGGPEHSTLQSKAGYIDARPQSRQTDENLLQRTAGPYIWVKLRRSAPPQARPVDLQQRKYLATGRHSRSVPIADMAQQPGTKPSISLVPEVAVVCDAINRTKSLSGLLTTDNCHYISSSDDPPLSTSWSETSLR